MTVSGTESRNGKLRLQRLAVPKNPGVKATVGLPETVIPDVVVYKFVQRKHFVLNLIYCFAVLFNTTQQSSRYPTLVGGDLLLPAKQYGLPKIVEGLITIVPWFDYILREIYE